MANFNDINFRYTDARNEKLYSPEVLQRAFVDLQSCVEKIAEPDKYIVYGAKGSGKTALGSYYELLAEAKWDIFARIDDLEDFDYSLLSDISAKSRIPQTVGAWKFLLAIRLYALLAEDEGLRQVNPNLNVLLDDLDKRGLLPSPNLSKLAERTLERGAEIGFSFFAEIKAKIGDDSSSQIKSPTQIADSLIDFFRELQPCSARYLLFVDGLDHVLRYGSADLPAIADLISAARIINEVLLETGLSAKIVILIRDEIARIVPNPDLAKRLSDNGLLLDWYRDVRDPFRTDLLQVIEKRATLVGFQNNIEELFNQWLPLTLFHRSTAAFILERTRFLPRDLIRFFYYLQILKTKPKYSPFAVFAAENSYSQWLYDELSDSLAGLIDDQVRRSLNSILQQLGRFFTVDELEKTLDQYDLNDLISGELLAQIMFETHWIGNYRRDAKGTEYFTFRSRSRSAGFSRESECIVTAGILKALNLNYRRDQQNK